MQIHSVELEDLDRAQERLSAEQRSPDPSSRVPSSVAMTPPDDANDAKPDYPVSDYPLNKLGSKSASISSASSVFLSPSADEDDDW